MRGITSMIRNMGRGSTTGLTGRFFRGSGFMARDRVRVNL